MTPKVFKIETLSSLLENTVAAGTAGRGPSPMMHLCPKFQFESHDTTFLK